MRTGRQAGAEQPLLEIDGLTVTYRVRRGVVHAVRSASLQVAAGETVAIVGESGSGKTTTAQSVLGLLPRSATVTGQIRFDGQQLVGLSERRLRSLRGLDMSLIPQDPKTSLNPVMRIGAQVAEVLTLHGLADRRTAARRAVELLAQAGMPEPELRARQYPSQLSGGMCQRALIAIAVAGEPQLIVADEPTSALDVTVQRRILDNIQALTQSSGTSVLLVTHDLALAAERADRIVVMRGGVIVEQGPAADVLSDPQDRYTRELLAAAPGLSRDRSPRVTAIDHGGHHDVSCDPFAGDAPAVEPSAAPLVQVQHLSKEFRLPRATGQATTIRAVDDVSFVIRRGETFALVGESGSGKSTTARLVLRLAAASSGSIVFDGEDITHTTGGAQRQLRRGMQIVYQNPFASLNPRMSIEQIVCDPLAALGIGSRHQRRRRAADLIDRVALPATTLGRRPVELSGGQRQRVAIARALAVNPSLVVCDEAVSALDVSIQAQILDLLTALQQQLGLSYLFISHDLGVVRQIAHRVGVMRTGQLLECGPSEQIFARPSNAYTQELLAAIPGRGQRRLAGQR